MLDASARRDMDAVVRCDVIGHITGPSLDLWTRPKKTSANPLFLANYRRITHTRWGKNHHDRVDPPAML